jgi:NADH-quinone oxidoreductase subunit A
VYYQKSGFLEKKKQTYCIFNLMKMSLLINYVVLYIYSLFCCIVCIAIYAAFYVFSQDGESHVDKTTPYECGFEAFGDARDSFDIKYYLLGVIFLIFDLELIFMLPFSVCISKLNILGISSFLFFFILLTTGFIFEWKKGSLDW